jgi:exopolysaccharide biosynthesis polyprenyl glycosylphosphotransferase
MSRPQVAERPAPKVEAEPGPAPFSTSRLQLQRLAPAKFARHFTHAFFRVATLLAADFLTYRALHFAILSVRDTGPGAWALDFLWASRPEFPGGGWNFAAALTLGLALTGAYGSGDNWTDGRRIFQGVLLAAALTFWGSFWLSPLVPAVVSFSVTLGIVTIALYFERQLLDLVVGRASLRAGRRVVFIGDSTSPVGMEVQDGFLDGTRMTSLGWITPKSGGRVESGGHRESGDRPEPRDREGERAGSRDRAESQERTGFRERAEFGGWSESRDRAESRDRSEYRVEYEGREGDIWDILHGIDADTVILCGNFPTRQFRDIVHAASTAGCRIISPSRYGHLLGTRPSWFRGAPVMELTLPVLKTRQLIAKRLTDILVSATGLALLSPLLLFIAIRIKLDSPGPVLFSQERVGYGGRVFRMLKFRTMSESAELEKEALAHLNESGDPRLFKIENDPRVTRLGTWLRAWSLDELPQLWNVLRGDMSLVGPRPFFENDLPEYSDHHFDRLAAKPGITGLWQVMGRSAVTDFEEVVRMDREYVSRWSLRLDLHILLRTLPAVFSRRGAY